MSPPNGKIYYMLENISHGNSIAIGLRSQTLIECAYAYVYPMSHSKAITISFYSRK